VRLIGVASLTDALLVPKGEAAPSRPLPPPKRTGTLDDARPRVQVRLDQARHRRLRIAAAHFRQSVQAVMMTALDHYLDRIVPSVIDAHCECLCGGGRAGDDTVVPFVPHAP
jgi:hypothetical protein